MHVEGPGIEWRPLARTTTHIIIPPRPFLVEVLKDDVVLRKVHDEFMFALRRAVWVPFERAGKGGR